AAWFGMINGWKPLGLLILAALVHEGGHLAVLAAFGTRVTALHLSVLGAELRTDGLRLTYPQELAAVLAGPLADLLCGAAAAAAAGAGRLSYTAAGAFWVLGLFNLLPIRQLDGGRALLLLVTWLAGPAAGERVLRAAGVAAAFALAAILFYLVAVTGGNIWLLPAAVCAAGAGIRELLGR
ncbi:MAG: hypothetical protein LKJ80_07395, partial [Oscillibacter sp.]|nr:hypothetical protein [Oscillibacter sp.]